MPSSATGRIAVGGPMLTFYLFYHPNSHQLDVCRHLHCSSHGNCTDWLGSSKFQYWGGQLQLLGHLYVHGEYWVTLTVSFMNTSLISHNIQMISSMLLVSLGRVGLTAWHPHEPGTNTEKHWYHCTRAKMKSPCSAETGHTAFQQDLVMSSDMLGKLLSTTLAPTHFECFWSRASAWLASRITHDLAPIGVSRGRGAG